MDTKLSLLRAAWARGDRRGALRIAVRFPRLDDAKVPIERAWQALQRPDFVREIGRDPDADTAAGYAALAARYGLPL